MEDFTNSPKRKLSPEEMGQLVEKLLDCPSMRDRHSREAVVLQLDDSIAQTIPRHATDKVDVMNIIRTCLNYSGGIDQLLKAIDFFEGGSLSVQQLKNVLQNIFLTSQVSNIKKQNIPLRETMSIPQTPPFEVPPKKIPKPLLGIKRIVCPACFEEIYLGECAIVSGRTNDKVLKRAPKGFFARLFVESLDDPKYAPELACRECTSCGYHLPCNVELVSTNLTLAVVGDVFSGKSTYIASLIQQIKKEWISNKNNFVSINCLTPHLENYYIDEYFEPIFVYKRGLAATFPAIESTANPLIYNLVISPSQKRRPISFNLMIYDVSGEDLHAERLVKYARFVLNASAIIFAVDPWSISDITNAIPSSSLTPTMQRVFDMAHRRGVAKLLNEIIGVLERYSKYSQGAHLFDIPMAIMLSKSDLLKHLASPNNYTFMKNPFYEGELDIWDINTVNQEVRNLLVQYKQSDLLTATNSFKQVKFFATSATGQSADENGYYPNVEPCRCLDPFLWTLYRLGIIEGR